MSVYHGSCLSTARNCFSGCCKIGGRCAEYFNQCQYRYLDYYTNPNYYFKT